MDLDPTQPVLGGILSPDDERMLNRGQLTAEMLTAIYSGRADDAEMWCKRLVGHLRQDKGVKG